MRKKVGDKQAKVESMRSNIVSKTNSGSNLANNLHSSNSSSQSGFFTARENKVNRKDNIYYWSTLRYGCILKTTKKKIANPIKNQSLLLIYLCRWYPSISYIRSKSLAKLISPIFCIICNSWDCLTKLKILQNWIPYRIPTIRYPTSYKGS